MVPGEMNFKTRRKRTLHAVADAFRVSRKDPVHGRKRVFERQVAMAILHELGFSNTHIAAMFRRSNAAVAYAVQRVGDLCATEVKTRNQVEAIREEIAR